MIKEGQFATIQDVQRIPIPQTKESGQALHIDRQYFLLSLVFLFVIFDLLALQNWSRN